MFGELDLINTPPAEDRVMLAFGLSSGTHA